MAWLTLSVAIVLEVIGTSFLKASEGFTKVIPSAIALACYGGAVVLLSLAVRVLDVGIAYAVWAGVGTALVVVISWLVFGQSLDLAAWIGVAMIVGGGVVINAFSANAE